jgi:WD40 repeat protein
MKLVFIVLAGLTRPVHAAPPADAIVTLPMLESIVLHAAFSRDGSRLVVGEELGRVTVWEVTTGTLVRDLTIMKPLPQNVDEELPEPNPGELLVGGMTQAVAINRDGSMVAAAHNWSRFDPGRFPLGQDILGSLARTWRVRDGKVLAKYDGHKQPIRAMAFNPGATLVSTLDESFRFAVWESRTGRERETFGGGTQIGRGSYFENGDTCFDAGGVHAASILPVYLSPERLEPPTLRLWDAKSRIMRSIVAPPELGEEPFWSVSLLPSGRFAAVPTNSAILLFGLDENQATQRIPITTKSSVGMLAPSPDGRRFLGWSGLDGLWIIHASDGRVQPVSRKVPGMIRTVCWLEDRILVATGGDHLPAGVVRPAKRDPVSLWSIPLPLP